MSDAPDPEPTAAATPEQLKRSAELSKLEPEFPAIVGGRYELQGLLAKGGMGSVHTAWDRTFQRTVAVKLIHGSTGNLQALARFKHESLVSGQLQHPNIPPVYDLGTYGENKPFLAMKLVKGRTLADHIKHPDADTPNLVAVFENVCHAVGYAHSRHVVHRDLKPLNVMVGAFGEVQVMDWGLAKVLTDRGATAPSDYDPDATSNLGTKIGDAESTDDSKTTAGTILGTPAYMPPEQAIGAIDQISERSDVFGLGAILCAILTGKAVFVGRDSESTRQMAARAETAEAFARLDASGAEPELIALAKRCLAAKPAERFANGTEVANEVARIRAAADERAKQAEIGRARSEARRRVLAWSAAIVVIVLAAGIVGTALGLIEARNQETEAKKQEGIAKEESTAKGLALEAEKVAKAEAEKNLVFAKVSNQTLRSVFEKLDPINNYESVGAFARALKQPLRVAARNLNDKAIGEPLSVAAMQNDLGLSLLALGDFEQAIELFQNALVIRKERLGPEHADTLVCMSNLASGYHASGQNNEALTLYEESYKIKKKALGPFHRDTLTGGNNLALGYQEVGRNADAVKLHEATLEQLKAALGPDHQDTLSSMNNLASSYEAAGRLKEALQLYESTHELMKSKLGAKHPDFLLNQNNLATAYQAAGKLDLALPLFEENLNLTREILGSDHPDTLRSLNNLAAIYQAVGRLDDALDLHEETFKLAKSILGSEHPHTLISMNNLAESYRNTGRFEDAIRLFEQVLRIRNKTLGPGHPDTFATMKNLAVAYTSAGRRSDAIPLFEETLKLQIVFLGPEHPATHSTRNNLAFTYRVNGQLEKALPLAEANISYLRKRLANNVVGLAGGLAGYSQEYLSSGEYHATENWLRECLAIREMNQPNDWLTFNTQSMLGEALLGQKKYTEAEPLLVKGYEGMMARAKTIPPAGQIRIPESLDRLIWLYTVMDRPADAQKYRELRAKYPKEQAPRVRPAREKVDK